jgi:hypothetical protein
MEAGTVTPKERQRWLRIRLSVAAWAYEVQDRTIMSDATYDRLCLEVDTSITTGNKRLDTFFKRHFDPNTGVWVRKHPEPRKLERIIELYHPEI